MVYLFRALNLIIGQEIGNQKDEVKGGGDNDLYNYSSSNEDELFKSVKKNIKAKGSDNFFLLVFFFSFHLYFVLFSYFLFIIVLFYNIYNSSSLVY